MGLLSGFLALMVSGVPVAIAMALASLAYVMVSGNIPDFVVIHRMYGGVDSFPLLAVPFFIWAGNLMNSAGITNRIYNFALALVGWLKGGLGHVNVVGSMVFAGQVTSGEFWKMHTLGKTSLSAYPDCGRAATGAIAEIYRVYLVESSLVRPDGSGAQLETAVSAYARNIEGTSGTRVACGSTGQLEQRIRRAVTQKVGATPR